MHNLVLIDDEEGHLLELYDAVKRVLPEEEAEIRPWRPTRDHIAADEFGKVVDSETALVVTDENLTSGGQTGLFGSAIVAWCQARAIPVGDYSRANRNELPKEPNQYEIRIPDDPEDAGIYVAGTFRGFVTIRRALDAQPGLLDKKESPVRVLCQILGRPQEEARFALYGSRTGAANAALVDLLSAEKAPDKRALVCYVVGHLLLNVVMRFPSPLLSRGAVAAYLAIDQSEIGNVEELFAQARYSGPFSEIEPFYWLSDIDEGLEAMRGAEAPETVIETQGQLNRETVESRLGRQMARHDCPRCRGKNGGFLCPFTKRTVCELPDCSVGSSGWIPQGARLCRIEREFYDEWAPMLGF